MKPFVLPPMSIFLCRHHWQNGHTVIKDSPTQGLNKTSEQGRSMAKAVVARGELRWAMS